MSKCEDSEEPRLGFGSFISKEEERMIPLNGKTANWLIDKDLEEKQKNFELGELRDEIMGFISKYHGYRYDLQCTKWPEWFKRFKREEVTFQITITPLQESIDLIRKHRLKDANIKFIIQILRVTTLMYCGCRLCVLYLVGPEKKQWCLFDVENFTTVERFDSFGEVIEDLKDANRMF